MEGALTFWHLDSDGFSTVVGIRYGKKLWFFGCNDKEEMNHLSYLFSRIWTRFTTQASFTGGNFAHSKNETVSASMPAFDNTET